MRTGRYGEYQWLESASCNLRDLLAAFPEVVTGRCLAIASFDSGPLKPSGAESERDWIFSKGVAYIPRVSDVSSLPFDEYDEWYVLDTCREIGTVDTFVSYCGFGLSDPEEWERQVLFWYQMDRIQPVACILNGDLFVFVTRDPGLHESVTRWLSGEKRG